MAILNVAIQVMIYISIGYLLRRLDWVKAEAVGSINKLMLNVALPCLVVNSMIIPFEREKLQNGMLSVCMVALLLSCFALAGFLWARIMKRDNIKARLILVSFCTFNNFMLIGVPIIASVFGPEGVFYTGLMGLPQRIVIFSLMPLVFTSLSVGGGERPAFRWSMLVQVPTISVGVGLVMFLTQWQLPEVIRSCMQELAGMTAPLGVAVAGMQLADVDIKKLLRDVSIPLSMMFKLMVNPLIAYALLSLLHFPRLLIQMGIVFGAIPAPTLITVYAANYEVEPGYSGALLFFSVLFGTITLPFWAYMATQVLL